MIQLTNLQSQTLLEVLEQLHLSKEQIEQLEDYIDGKVGEEVLSNLSFQDLRKIYHKTSSTLFLTLVNKGLTVEAKRYFDILFAIGGPSCSNMLPDGIMMINRDKKLGIEAEKIIAVYAYENGERPVSEPNKKRFEEVIKGDAELIRKALLYKNGQKESGKLVLYALYFLLKYPNGKPDIPKGEEKNFSDGIHRFFQKKKNKAEELLQGEDQKLMQEYEDCVCGQVNYMLNQGLLSDEIQRITEALHQEELLDETKQLVRRHTVVFDVVKRVTGLAFINFAFSNCLRNFLSLALFINRSAALDGMEAADFRQDLKIRGGNFDQLFGIDTEKYIIWAAIKFHKNILRIQFEQNRETYIHCCDTASVQLENRMVEIIKEKDFSFYQERMKTTKDAKQKKIIKELTTCYNCHTSTACFSNIVNSKQVGDVVQKYLEGEVGIDQMYLYEDQMVKQYGNQSLLEQYYHDFGEDEFYRRCLVYIAMEQCSHYFRNKMNSNNVKKETQQIFIIFKQEQMDLVHQVKILALIAEGFYLESLKEKFLDAAKEIFKVYLLNRREEMLAAFHGSSVVARQFGLKLLADQAEENKKDILAFSQDSSKLVRESLLEILYQHTDWESEVKVFLNAKKAKERELGIRVLAHWDIQKYQKELEQALEKEKNGKVRTLITELLQMESVEANGKKVLVREDLIKDLHKGGRARSLAWAYQTEYSIVHKKSGEEASKEYLQAILLCYSTMQPCGVNANAAFLAEELNKAELAIYINELFDRWIEAGAEAKKRWVLFAASIHGGIEIIKKLQHQIQEWPKYARGAIASDVVQALALSPDPQALLIVDGIARKFKFKQVKAAAGKALDFAAAQLGLEREELEDRIVPDLGFNEQMERVFDYGERSFTVTITTALEIEVFDEKKKKLKNLPAPGKKDDPQKAAVAYETFKQMKKQMKTTITSQKARLDFALSSERIWSVEAWKALFVKNPLMHQFAIGLIWGIYQDGVLVQSFRYMEDGTFNTEEEEEFLLPKEGRIGLVHPIELSEESRTAWREQLEDYEIVQPIVQMEREIFYLTEEEKDARCLERFGGCIVNDLSLGGKLQGFGWYRGSILDGGGFYTFYREDAKIGYGVELHFSGSFVGGGGEGDVTLYDARFYKVGTVDRGSYSYDNVGLEEGLLLSEVPKRYFSEIVLQLAIVTAFCKEKNEEWRKERR